MKLIYEVINCQTILCSCHFALDPAKPEAAGHDDSVRFAQVLPGLVVLYRVLIIEEYVLTNECRDVTNSKLLALCSINYSINIHLPEKKNTYKHI